MKKRLVASIAGLALATGTLTFATAGPVNAAPVGCSGKEVNKKIVGYGGSDITGGDTDFVASGDGYDITLHLILDSTSCTNVTYAASATVSDTGAAIDSQSANGDGVSNIVDLSFHATTAQATTSNGLRCVNFAATTANGTKPLDAAPDTGSLTFCDPDQGGGFFH